MCICGQWTAHCCLQSEYLCKQRSECEQIIVSDKFTSRIKDLLIPDRYCRKLWEYINCGPA